jgi:steroid delta-isomerase-like uncharacterized protein
MQETIEKNKQIVRGIFEDFVNVGNISPLTNLAADEFEGPNGAKGPEGFIKPYVGLVTGFPDIHYTLIDLIAEGDKVVVRWSWKGTHQGNFMGYPASGKSITNEGVGIFQLKDGKILRAWVQTDRVGFMQDMEILPRDLRSIAASKPK